MPIALSMNGDGLLNSDKILWGGSSHTIQDLVGLKIEADNISDTMKVVSPDFKHAKGEMLPPSAEEALTLAGVLRSLFGTAKTKVLVGGIESSARLVALSKKMKDDAKATAAAEKQNKRMARARQVDLDIISSDEAVPIKQLFGSKVAVGKSDAFFKKPPTRS